MKYIVKCRFCGRSYVVDSEVTGADFMCEDCAGNNNIRDVEERIQEKPKGEDLDIANIKRFDMSMHPVDEEYCYDMSKERWIAKLKYAGMVIVVTLVMLALEVLFK